MSWSADFPVAGYPTYATQPTDGVLTKFPPSPPPLLTTLLFQEMRSIHTQLEKLFLDCRFISQSNRGNICNVSKLYAFKKKEIKCLYQEIVLFLHISKDIMVSNGTSHFIYAHSYACQKKGLISKTTFIYL